MQEEGNVQFLLQRSNSPTCCSYHPKEQYTFAFGGSEGKIALMSAIHGEVIRSITIPSLSLARALNSITFSPDGTKVISTAVTSKVTIVDVERGDPVLSYDNCASPGEGRQPLVMHPELPNMAACTTVNARGITVLDLRMPLPVDFIYDLHEGSINDLCFLDGSWPWGSGKTVLVSGSSVGQMKVNTVDGRPVCAFTTQSPITCLTPSPEPYNTTRLQGYPSVMMVSTGEGLVCWTVGERPWKWESQRVSPSRAACMKHTSGGGILYTAQGNAVNKYRRYLEGHQNVGQAFTHTAPILDLDISPNNEYVISVGQDHKVGLLRLGLPLHGSTQYAEFT